MLHTAFFPVLMWLSCTFFSTCILAQHTIYEPLDLDAVHYAPEDFGRMWTFDAVPKERFAELYQFTPTEEWLDDVRLSALRFSNGCSGSFVSEDGLIITNHHCIRGKLHSLEGEDLLRDGFYAETLKEERRISEIYVSQLLSIRDVTEEIQTAMAEGKTDEEKLELRDRKIWELTRACDLESGKRCQMVSLYHGGKFVLHTYELYSDIRLVMVPDVQITSTGWDWDNFTYPRYELDFVFLRAYGRDDKPVKSPHFFQWSQKGAGEGEPVFVVGCPEGTSRLLSLEELDYYRNIYTPASLILLNEKYRVQDEYFKAHPEEEARHIADLLYIANPRKVNAGLLMALNDEYLMTKKRDFERELKSRMMADEALNDKYGDIWEKIEEATSALEQAYPIYIAHQPTWSARLSVARQLLQYAQQMQLQEDRRDISYKGGQLESTKRGLTLKIEDEELERMNIRAHANFLAKVIGEDSPSMKVAYGGHMGDDAVQFILENCTLTDPEVVKSLLNDPESILTSKDPYLQFARMASDHTAALVPEVKAAQKALSAQNLRLAELIFAAFGTDLPPDGTGSLRISDGRVKGYEYNGTLAPAKTTYFGLWNRYYSFGKTSYPWGLHQRWKTPPPGLDLSIPICFVSDNDLSGNFGSVVINRNAELVGLGNDGNLESLAGSFIFIPEVNRTVSTDSWGLIEALRWVYKTERLVKELEEGGL